MCSCPGCDRGLPLASRHQTAWARPGRGCVGDRHAARQRHRWTFARQVRLYGPGDITGIDPQQVIRTEPRHLATDFEPNYFPAIEFDRPDFPWLFTPAKADTDGKLRPWLCLVVVRQTGRRHVARRALVCRCRCSTSIRPAQPERELPDLRNRGRGRTRRSQAASGTSRRCKQALAGDPALTVSRLLCPRRLDPLTEYLACVVPAFELGRKAGLGMPITSDDEQSCNRRGLWESKLPSR